jgi:hypothetical protein
MYMFYNGNCFKKTWCSVKILFQLRNGFTILHPVYGRRSETVFLNFSGAQESIPTAYVACGAGTKTIFLLVS